MKFKDEMIDAMMNELEASSHPSPVGEERNVVTIYFGGGTPSLLNANDVKKLLSAVYEKFNADKNVEITLEANPDDINEQKLQKWKCAGINRLSVGIQSFKNDDLLWMNRAHNAEQARHCIQLIKEAGFENFSVDLIYGTPTLSNDDWKKNVETVIELNVPHLSCYALTVEHKTALQKMIELKNKKDIDPEKQALQFLLLMDWLNNAGYEHYEISNFAKPGFRSRHNSSYWQGKSYIGIGPSAHSFDGNKRKWNISNNQLYIQSIKNNIIPYEEETLSKTQKLNEYIMTSLRTIEGLDLNFVRKSFGEEVDINLKTASKKWKGKLKIENDKIILTNEGKLFADGITSDLFLEEEKLML